MSQKVRVLTGLALSAALVVAGAGAANAQVAKSGTYNCTGAPLSGYVYSATGGTTKHSHQNRSTGAMRYAIDTNGGYFTSNGYQNEAWVVTATDFINTAIGSCH